ncbi:Uncharacterized protein DAT39_011010 [Clarias magur]|uniref:Uncharacterized protein n=1 Tax=Clarias magur TaxID=1594786 RepID=A0A8J4UK89_CLAMG|nr:Uncharacterized protein DAT39_011010 [Clarias magur]
MKPEVCTLREESVLKSGTSTATLSEKTSVLIKAAARVRAVTPALENAAPQPEPLRNDSSISARQVPCAQVQSAGCLFDLQSASRPDGNALVLPIITVKCVGPIPPQLLTDEKQISSPRSPVSK